MKRLCALPESAIRTALAAALRGLGTPRLVHRLDALLLVSLGRSCYEVAHWLGEDPRTVERWVHAYEERGLDGLRDHHSGGRPAPLDPAQMQRLRAELVAGPPHAGYAQPRWSGKLMALHLQRHYGVVLGPRQCLRLLQRLSQAH